MGCLRTLFALSVVLLHEGVGEALIGGRNAVQLFYIISGFLISYILVERHDYKNKLAFYLNRFLRLYPIYGTVAVISLGAFILLRHTPRDSTFFDVYALSPPGARDFLILSNIMLVGQDWVNFLAVKAGALVFSSNFIDSDVLLFKGLVVPQAWTLGLELTFYAVAPFVLPNRRAIYALLMLSLTLRICLVVFGPGSNDPWTYRFFPTELALFLVGALAHQVLLPIYRKRFGPLRRIAANVATGSMVLLSITYPLIPFGEGPKTAILFSTFVVLVPFTFLFQETSKLDSWIGNLSYPIYVDHMLVFHVFGHSLKALGFSNQTLIATAGVVGSIIVAVLLNKLIADPIEYIRRNIKRNQKLRESMPQAAIQPAEVIA